MDYLVFWLPTVGGLLLGTFAAGEWYSGNKIVAVWLGFAGIICFLLVAAIQLQQAVMRDKASPTELSATDLATKRAYVALDHFQVDSFDTSIRVQPQWRNSGATPTKDMTNHVNWSVFAGEPPEDYHFPDLDIHGRETETGKGNLLLYVGPNGGTAFAEPLIIPNSAFDMARAGKGRIFVWGWTEYHDVFPGTPVRRTEFCYEIVMEFSKDVGTAHEPKVQAALSFRIYGRHNCIDDECGRQNIPQ